MQDHTVIALPPHCSDSLIDSGQKVQTVQSQLPQFQIIQAMTIRK